MPTVLTRVRTLCAGLCAIATLAVLLWGINAGAARAAGAGAARSSAVPQGFVGMTIDGPMWPNIDPRVNLPHDLDRMVSSGVENLRAPVYWSSFQPYQTFAQVPRSDTRQFVSVHGVPTAFGSLDALVALAAARHLTILPIVVDAPTWDAVRPHGVLLHTPKHNAPFAQFLAALVHRYGPHGSFWALHRALPRVPIRNWQIWNEPYLSGDWALSPWPRTFLTMVHAAHDAIKHADPGAKIVLAGLASYSFTYLKQIYAVPHARRYFDVIAIHPYTAAPQGVITLLHLARQAMAAGGDSGKPIEITELGWPSSCQHMVGPPTRQSCRHWLTQHPFGWETDLTGQKQRLATVLRLLNANRVRLHVIGFDYYDWASVESPSASFNFAGLFRVTNHGLIAKPVFGAFVNGALALEHCKVKGTVATRCVRGG